MASLSNINGLFDVHSTGAILFSTSHGTSGQILRSNGNAAPTWVDSSTIIGGPYLPLTGGTLTGPLSGTSATFSGTVIGTTARFDTLNDSANSKNLIYRDSSGAKTVVGGGSTPDKIYILDGGNVGIGASLPSTPLTVNRASNSTLPTLYLDTNGGGGGSVGLGQNTAIGPYLVGNTLPNGNVRGAYSASRMLFNGGGFSFQTSNETSGARTFDDKMKILINGNVGVGTTSPDALLELEKNPGTAALGPVLLLNNSAGTIGDQGAIIFSSAGNTYQRAKIQFTVEGNPHASDIQFYTGRSDLGTLTSKMAILGNGNVGIGTDSPRAVGSGYKGLEVSSSSSGSSLWLSGFSDTTKGYLAMDTGGLNLTAISNHSLTFGTNNSPKMTILSDGKVGIGITNPQDKLHVNGDAIISSTRFGDFATASMNTTGVVIARVAASTNGQSAIVEFVASGNNGAYYNVVYSCYNGGGAWFYSKNVVGSGGNIEVAETNGGGSSELTFKFRATSGSASYTPRVMMKGMPYNLVTF